MYLLNHRCVGVRCHVDAHPPQSGTRYCPSGWRSGSTSNKVTATLCTQTQGIYPGCQPGLELALTSLGAGQGSELHCSLAAPNLDYGSAARGKTAVWRFWDRPLPQRADRQTAPADQQQTCAQHILLCRGRSRGGPTGRAGQMAHPTELTAKVAAVDAAATLPQNRVDR